MDAQLRQSVRHWAAGRCEYCGLRQEQEPLPFHVEHIIPRQHEGRDLPENLALACHHCNLHKGPNLSGLDPQTSQLTRLFHPRLDVWNDHFTRRGGEIVGLSAIGRTTVRLLKMNEDGRNGVGSWYWQLIITPSRSGTWPANYEWNIPARFITS